MKEVKEVVHVPTKELAEEVLRVAKENGLMKSLRIHHWDEYLGSTYFRNVESGSYGRIDDLLYDDDKVITAQEFLSRYTPKFRPIAMRCTQDQFDAVKGKLGGCDFGLLADFEDFEYLSNNVNGFELLVSNINYSRKECNNRQVFEEWNEKTFLEYCGIDVKEEVSEVDRLRKENAELKKQLQAINDQPKVGDVCLFWEPHCKWSVLGVLDRISINGGNKGYYSEDIEYEYCVKATPENIQAKINELKND